MIRNVNLKYGLLVHNVLVSNKSYLSFYDDFEES